MEVTKIKSIHKVLGKWSVSSNIKEIKDMNPPSGYRFKITFNKSKETQYVSIRDVVITYHIVNVPKPPCTHPAHCRYEENSLNWHCGICGHVYLKEKI